MKRIPLFYIGPTLIYIDSFILILSIATAILYSQVILPFSYRGLTQNTYWILSCISTICIIILFIVQAIFRTFCCILVQRPLHSYTVFLIGNVCETQMGKTNTIEECFSSLLGVCLSAIISIVLFILLSIEKSNLWAIEIIIITTIVLFVNTLVLLCNVLPVYPMDVGKVVMSFLTITFKNKKKILYLYAETGKVIGLLIIAFGLYRLVNGFLIPALTFVIVGISMHRVVTISTLGRNTFDTILKYGILMLVRKNCIKIRNCFTVDQFIRKYSLCQNDVFLIENDSYEIEKILNSRQIMELSASSRMCKIGEVEFSDIKIPIITYDTNICALFFFMVRTGIDRCIVIKSKTDARILGLIFMNDILLYLIKNIGHGNRGYNNSKNRLFKFIGKLV